MTGKPTLVVISGPPGAGKTTLAHELAKGIGCPAICRDELKEGMAHATPGYAPTPEDPLPLRTLGVFFDVLDLLLTAGVSVIAEAAFQDRLWRPGLERLAPLAQIRIVHCDVPGELAYARRRHRAANDPLRQIHEPAGETPVAELVLRAHETFDAVSINAPSIRVDTSSGYSPGIADIVAFVNAPAPGQESPAPPR